MNNSFSERVNVLTELLNEGHLTNDEYLDLIESLRGGPLTEENEYKVEGHEGPFTVRVESDGFHSDQDDVVDYTYLEEINNPNKLEEYENFINDNKMGDYEKALHGDYPLRELYNLSNPIHNTFYHIINKKEVEESAKRYQDMVGLYKQDVHSGNIIRGCEVRVDNGGRIDCVEPFHSYEYNTIPVKEHPAYEDIIKGLADGRIVLS